MLLQLYIKNEILSTSKQNLNYIKKLYIYFSILNIEK